jgi:fructose-1,6-bisphosphatase I
MAFISTNRLITIDSHIQTEESKHPEATGEFTSLLHDLTLAMRIISFEVRRAGLNDILGITQNINIHGEIVRKLDEFAQMAIVNSMSRGGYLCAMASEEADGLIKLTEGLNKGKYVLLFDPLDGSTNIDVNITIGTIFSLYKRIDDNSELEGDFADILQEGYKQVSAGYCLYGSSTILVYTTGHGVNVFTYDPTIGEFLLTFENLRIPKRGRFYSCNAGNYYLWEKNVRDYIKYITTPSEDTNKPYTLRYVASSVADIHRTIHYGGIYLYPCDTKYPNGKMRLVYEVNPLSFIMEQAGGKASTGFGRILDIKPTDIHQRVPFFIGSPDDVEDLERFMKLP